MPQEPKIVPTTSDPVLLSDAKLESNASVVPYTINEGISNLGSTCYMNSVVQILANFYPDIFADKTGPLAEAGKKLLRAVRQEDEEMLLLTAEDRRKKIREMAKIFFYTLGEIKWGEKQEEKYILNPNIQEDAQELMTKVFDWAKMPMAIKPLIDCVKDGTECNPVLNDLGEWNNYLVEIPLDKGIPNTMQAWFDYSFIPHSDMMSFRKDSSKNRSYRLGKLNNLSHQTFPLMLGRFKDRYNADTGEWSQCKVTELVSGALDGLTIYSHQMVDSKLDIHCELVGFIVHDGPTLLSGHYIAYAKLEGQWIEYNDGSRPRELSDSEARNSAEEAYIFFYKKKEAPEKHGEQSANGARRVGSAME